MSLLPSLQPYLSQWAPLLRELEEECGTDPDLPNPLYAADSGFVLQELIAARIQADCHDVQAIIALPTARLEKGKSPESKGAPETDSNVWLYEQLNRRVAFDMTCPLLLALQEHCTRQTCPEMKAGEWLYLCAAHATNNERECCAIDYCTHTLDGATALLNSSRYFPSRLSINQSSVKHFTSIARRLYRIFAHAYFHHREIFDEAEAETSLYSRFLAISTLNGLISDDLLIVPQEIHSEAADLAR